MSLTTRIFLCIMVLPMVVFSDPEIKSYNSQKQVCCDGVIHDVPEPAYQYYCCGQEQYKYGEALCCPDDTLIPLPEEADGNTYEFSCCLKDDGTTEVYNRTSHFCCDGNLAEKTEEAWGDCCGKQFYNYNTEICCNEEVHQQAENLDCCGEEVLYDTTSQLCCQTWEKKEDADDDDDDPWVRKFEVHETTSDTARCCELEMYDTKTQYCADETVQEKPADMSEEAIANDCSGEVYDQNTQVCCQKWELVDDEYEITASKVHEIVGNKTYCCEENVYDYEEEVCCDGGLVLTKPEGSEDERRSMYCCEDKVISYTSYSSYRCINNKIVDPDVSVCGDDTYNYSTHSCCYETIYSWSGNDSTAADSCCYQAHDAYNSNTDLCCGDEILSRESVGADDEDDSCCVAYDN